jgi:phosphopantetheine adenylyltransferase
MAPKDPPQFLLLLPPGPTPPTAQALHAAFGDTVAQVLKEVASHSSESKQAAVLEIALACPHLIDCERTPRTALFDETQSYLAAVYKLICTVAAKNNINVEDVDGVDVRILLVNWSQVQQADGPSVTDEKPYGPVISMQTLARSKRPWQFAFGTESEAGEAMVQSFIAAKGSGEQVQRVMSGPVMHAGNAQTGTTTSHSDDSNTGQAHNTHTLHPHVAVGGTFDHIHIGHKLLLTMTVFAVDEDNANALKQRSATIGITGDQLLKNKKHAEVLESWEDRYEYVMAFINAIVDFAPPNYKDDRQVSVRDDPGPNGKSMDTTYPNGLTIKCTEIQDPFGPTITEEQISALIISAETRAGGKAVNDKRNEKKWKSLDIFEVDVLDAEDEGDGAAKKESFESKLSSTAIREKLAKKRQSSL